MIPLASDLLPFPGQMRREDLLKVRQSARPAFFIRPRNDSGHCFLEVSRGTSRSVDKSPAMWQSSHRKQSTDRRGSVTVRSVAPLRLNSARHCPSLAQSPLTGHVRAGHPEQRSITLWHRRRDGCHRQSRAQLSAPMECRAKPRPAGNPAQSRNWRCVPRPAALGPYPALVPRPDWRAQADQCQVRDSA